MTLHIPGAAALAPSGTAMVDPFGLAGLLSQGVGDRPLRFALRLLHGREHDLPAARGPAHAGGTRPAVQRVHRKRCAQAADDRRRAAGARESCGCSGAVAPLGERRLDELTLTTNGTPAGTIRGRLARRGRAAHQRLAGHARPGSSAPITRWGELEQVLDGIVPPRRPAWRSRSTPSR